MENETQRREISALLDSLSVQYPYGVGRGGGNTQRPKIVFIVGDESELTGVYRETLEAAVTKGLKLCLDDVDFVVGKENLSVRGDCIIVLGEKAREPLHLMEKVHAWGIFQKTPALLTLSIQDICRDKDAKKLFWHDLQSIPTR